jgi:hypothetical protein
MSLASPAVAQQGGGTVVPERTNVFKPAKVEVTPFHLAARI